MPTTHEKTNCQNLEQLVDLAVDEWILLFDLLSSRVRAVFLRGNSTNIYILLQIFLSRKVDTYPWISQEKIIPKHKNICLYSIIYSN
jgi:hypothetical protein